MNCAISEESQYKLKVKIAKDLTSFPEGEMFDLKNYIKSVYDMVYNKNQDENQALDYARLIPNFINQLQGVEPKIQKLLFDSSVDLNTIGAMSMQGMTEEGLGMIKKYLGLDKNVTQETLKVLNKMTPQKKEEVKELTREESLKEQIEDIDSEIKTYRRHAAESDSFRDSEASERKADSLEKTKEQLIAELKSIETPIADNPPALNTVQIPDELIPDVTKAFDAASPTFLKDRPSEEGPGRTTKEDTEFYFGVKRHILSKLADVVNQESSRLKIGSANGVYLTAKSVAGEEGVRLVLTDSEGNDLKFNDQFEPTQGEGKIAYYNMHNPDTIINEDGTAKVNSQTFKKALESYINVMTAKASPEKMAKEKSSIKAQAIEHLTNEAKFLRSLQEYVNQNKDANFLTLEIVGGSQGYIRTKTKEGRNIPFSRMTALSAIKEDFTIKVANKVTAAREPGVFEYRAYLNTPGLHQQPLEIERPAVADTNNADLLKSLLFDEIVDYKGQAVPYLERRNMLRQYINVGSIDQSNEDKKIMSEVIMNRNDSKPYGFDLILQKRDGDKLVPFNVDFSDTKSIEEAKQFFDGIVNYKSKAGYYTFKMHVNKDHIDKKIKQPVLKQQDGKTVLTYQTKPYNQFLKEQQYKVHTEELSADGKLRRLNAYFNFKVTPETQEKLSPESAPEVAEVSKDVETYLPDEGIDDIIDNLIDKNREEGNLNKTLYQKNLNKAVTKEQIKEARKWFAKHPMSKYVTFEELFHKVNSTDAVATFGEAGIILYKGADYTDLYHEAFHAFTQGFLSPAERRDLYNEVRKKTGSFKDYEGRTVTYRYATDLQIEEFLAEEFRRFMLNGQLSKAKSPKQNSFFQKIWNILKTLFSDTTVHQMSLDAKADAKIHEIFSKLKIGDINTSNFTMDNAQFGQLNQGIRARATETGQLSIERLNYQDSGIINDIVDGFIAEFIDVMNQNLKGSERKELFNLRRQVASKDFNSLNQEEKDSLKAKLAALESKATNLYTSQVSTNKDTMSSAYKYAKIRLNNLKEAKEKSEKESTNPTEKNALRNDIRLLKFAIDNYGNTENLDANLSSDASMINGVLGYHMTNSAMFANARNLFEIEELSETEQMTQSQRGGFDRKGNEASLKDLAKAEIIYTLKLLPQVDSNGERVYDERFGTQKLADFQATWNRLARALQDTLSIEDMYDKIQDEARNYPVFNELLKRMGDPRSVGTNAEQHLWTSFWQTFNKTRVPLVQMTVNKSEDGKYFSTVGIAFSSDLAAGKHWQNQFKATVPGDNKYISTDARGNYLNTAQILKDFSFKEAANDLLGFYKAIGFDLTDSPEIRTALNRGAETKYTPEYIYDTLKELHNSKEKIRDLSKLAENDNITYTNLQRLESKYSDVFSNFMVTNAEGNSQFEHTLNNSMTVIVNSINNADTYDDLISQRHMSHLDINKNPFAESSKWLQSVFYLEEGHPKYGQRRTNKNGDPIKLRTLNLSGALIKSQVMDTESQEFQQVLNEGVSSAAADEFTKYILDLHLSFAGFPELMRHADKGTSYSVVVDGPFSHQNRRDELYIETEAFLDNVSYKKKGFEQVRPYLIAEMKRIKIIKEIAELAKDDPNYIFSHDYIKSGQSFTIFDDVLPSNVKESLIDLVENNSEEQIANAFFRNRVLLADVENSINEYFDKQFEDNFKRFSKTPFISDNIKDRLRKLVPAGKEGEVFVKSFTYNNWINNAESMTVLYGDLAQYNHVKEEFHKRNAGIGSTGTIYRTDSIMQDFINNSYWSSSYAAANAERLGIEGKNVFDGTFDTAIVEDQNVKSVYYDEYVEAFEKAEEGSSKYLGDYKKQTEADAQGLITFDAYRQLKVSEGSWSSEQEELFKKIVKGESVDNKDVVKFFPVIKGQYWGPLATESRLPIMAFHKYSLFPLIPTVVKGKNAEILHDKMVKENISYLTFESGSKVGTMTKGGKFDKLYTDPTGKRGLDEGIYNTETKTISLPTDESGNYIPHFTKNKIHLEYLKNQLEIHDESKGKVIFSTQLRKLVEDGLMEAGVPTDFKVNEKDINKRKEAWDSIPTEKIKEQASPYYKMLKVYESNIDALTKFQKEKLLKEVNLKYEKVNGKMQLVGDKSSLLTLVKNELTRQDLGQHSIDFIDTVTGNMKGDLSLSLQAEKIEKLINALMVKRLVKQKVNGEGLIQVATTLFEEMEGGDFTNATEEDIKKYRGSNDLPTYRQTYDEKGNPNKTTAMKVKVALRDGFTNLLNLNHTDGKKIRTIERLNEVIKNEEWLDQGDHRAMITMTGVRIPVQGLNSMEFMEVYEFLPAEAGSVIVPPTEIVTKSGADFDVDKMTVMMPNLTTINGVGELVKGRNVSATEEELKTQRKELSKQIKEIQDKYDDIFDRRDKEGEFAFSDQERAVISRINKEISNEKKNINTLNDEYQATALYDKRFDKQNKLDRIEEQLNDATVKLSNLYESKQQMFQAINAEKTKAVNQEKENELKPLKEKRGEVIRDINALSAKPIENELISNIRAILELPSNFTSLVRPNSTDIVDPLASELADKVMEYKPKDVIHGKKRQVEVRGKMKEIISPTRVLEAGYNLYKHTSNAVGKQTLGMGAIDNTYNTLFNRIGAYMEAYNGSLEEYQEALKAKEAHEAGLRENAIRTNQGKDPLPVPAYTEPQKKIVREFSKQTLLLPHNTLKIGGEDVISLSSLKDKEGVHNIADVVNQMINGWVDIAKDAWIFNIQGNKELTPTLLFLVQAGVPVDQAVYFMSNPLIREYVSEQKLAKSTFADPLNTIPSNPAFFRSTARDKVLEKYKMGKYTALKGSLKDAPQFTKDDIKGWVTNNKITDTDKNIFLHFLEIEEMSKSIRDVKMRTNVDTSRDVSLFEAQDRLEGLKELEGSQRLPTDLTKKIKDGSPIGSFFIQQFQIDLLGDAFPLRNHKFLNEFAKQNIDIAYAESTYGMISNTVINWKSDLVNFIYQNELTYFDINDMSSYKSHGIVENKEVAYLNNGAIVKNGKLYIDKETLKKQFENKEFTGTKSDTGYSTLKLAPVNPLAFDNINQYHRFVVEREILRSQLDVSQLKDSMLFKSRIDNVRGRVEQAEGERNDDYTKKIVRVAFEEYLRDEALTKSFNHWHMFKGPNSFATKFVKIKENYPALRKAFSLMDALEFNDGFGYKNLKLTNPFLEADQINILHENLTDRRDGITSMTKLRDVLPEASDIELAEITEFFKTFTHYAFMQSGMSTKSAFALTSIVPQDPVLRVVEQPVKKLMEELDQETDFVKNYVAAFNAQFKHLNAQGKRGTRVRGKNYSNNISLLNKTSLNNYREGFKDFEGNYILPKNFNSKVIEARIAARPEYVVVVPEAYAGKARPAKGTPSGLLESDLPNVAGLVSKVSYGMLSGQTRSDIIRDKDGAIDPEVKQYIDKSIQNLKEIRDSGKTLRFNRDGYGQDMLIKVDGAFAAPQTFLYLSEQLYKNFGYINKKYLETKTGKEIVYETEEISPMEVEVMKQVSDEAVRDFMKMCIVK